MFGAELHRVPEKNVVPNEVSNQKNKQKGAGNKTGVIPNLFAYAIVLARCLYWRNDGKLENGIQGISAFQYSSIPVFLAF